MHYIISLVGISSHTFIFYYSMYLKHTLIHQQIITVDRVYTGGQLIIHLQCT